MKSLIKLLVFVVLSVISNGIFAQEQNNVSGVVTNEKGEPLKSATVFIGGSERVTPADENGHFIFKNIPQGTFKLSVQMLGYEPLTRNIIVKGAPLNIEMKLKPKAIRLNEVKIGNSNIWKKNFELFKEQFLGRSRNAKQCEILNPQIINFTNKKGIVLADADEFLVIENKRLGYRIRYLLQDFGYTTADRTTLYHGEHTFEELDGTDEQKKEWSKNRAETYNGSFRHFLRSVYANNVLENGFVAKTALGYGKFSKLDNVTDDRDKLVVVNTPVKFDSLITAIDTSFVSLKFKQLYVVYDPKGAAAYRRDALKKTVVYQKTTIVINKAASLLKLFTDQAIIDKKGSYTDYRNFFIEGYWANARMGDELPEEYMPPFGERPRGNVPVNKPAFALQRWTDSIPQEKAYLHMDKPYYALSDTIWFKGYLTTGSRHLLSERSSAVYVDLINDQNQRVKTLKLQTAMGTVAGNFILDDSIKAGSYNIRAYTQWMRNAGEDYFFNKTFTIGDPTKPVLAGASKKDIKAALQQTDVQFFPESGNLVNGITSRIGFKAVAANGLGEAISGTITDSQNNEVATINTLHAGMGSFLLTPLPGKTYTANINFDDGSRTALELPAALYEGYVLSIYQPNTDSILVRIKASAHLQNTKLSLIAHSGGELIVTTPVEISSAITSVWLNKRLFPSGIAQFAIFNAKDEPLNERIAFIKNDDQMQLAINTPKTLYKSKENVQLELTAKESGGTPIAANFSVAVIDANKFPVDESAESTIFSNLLLTSDLKGYIEKPNYYFMTDSSVVNRALDNLMLTQGYRRFEWKSLLDTANTRPTFAAEGLGIAVTGTVETLTHKPMPNAAVLLVSTNARVSKTVLTDDAGKFKFDNLVFADSARFAIQAVNSKNSDRTIITIDSIPSAAITVKQNLAEVNIIKATLQKAADEGKPAKLAGLHALKEVKIKAVKVIVDENQDAMKQGALTQRDGSVDKVLRIENPEIYNTVGEFLLARVPGVTIETGPTGVTSLVDMRPSISVSGGTADSRAIGMLVNGISTGYDIDDVLNGRVFMVEDVDRIQIIRTSLPAKERMRVNYGPGSGAAGYINIILKHPSQRKQYNTAIANIMPKGYNKSRQFYSPRYDRPNNRAAQLPDQRSTILWAPYVNTDAEGKSTIDFFNADGPGTYRVVVEGINAAGELGRQVFSYKVEQ
jgi:hypothetical protein